MDNKVNEQERLFWWFVGFFDGEGWITMNIRYAPKRKKSKYRSIKPMIGIANTDFELIEKCHKILTLFKIGHHISHKYRKQYNNNKAQKAIQIAGMKRVKRFLDIFGDFLNKQKQVNLLRQFINYRQRVGAGVSYTEIEDDIYQELRKANQKGILRDYTPNTVNVMT